MAAELNPGVRLFWKLHQWAYRVTGGRIGGRLMGLPVLLLTTRGRRSGRPRRTALLYLPWEDAYVVIASFLGQPRDPFWWKNLQANPQASVQIGRRHVIVKAREAEGEERERIWNEMVSRVADYAEYAKRTERRIPVVVLQPEA